MHVQKTRAWPAAQIFVAPADREVRVERRDVHRKYAKRMIDVEQQLGAGGMRRGDDRRKVGKPLASVEDYFGDDDQVGSFTDCGENVGGVEGAIGACLDEGEHDPASRRVLAQDQVERIELAPRRDDARHAVVGIENGAQPLTCIRLRHDTFTARGGQEPGKPRPVRIHFRAPTVPGTPEIRVPQRQSLANVVVGRVERPPERVIGEIDPVTVGELVAREQRRDVALQGVFGQWPRVERANRRLDTFGSGRLRVHCGAVAAPMAVLTSISSGKNECASARFKKATPDEPPVPVLCPMIRSTVFI